MTTHTHEDGTTHDHETHPAIVFIIESYADTPYNDHRNSIGQLRSMTPVHTTITEEDMARIAAAVKSEVSDIQFEKSLAQQERERMVMTAAEPPKKGRKKA